MRVVIVDDSGVVRSVLGSWFAALPGVEVVGQHRDGESFIAALDEDRPDIVIMDIEMPGLDGLSASRAAIARRPDLAVIVTTGATRGGPDLASRCLAAGAVDVVLKPGHASGRDAVSVYREALASRIAAIALTRRARAAHGLHPRLAVARRTPAPGSSRDVLAIAASTGGPRAIRDLLVAIGEGLDQIGVIVVQHMPAAFTPSFARHLSGELGRTVDVCAGGEALRPGEVYLAPAGRHVEAQRRAEGLVLALSDAPAENYCKPSADVLFRSLARVGADRAIGVVLTGMGRDGAEGARALMAASAPVYAQDEDTSVVWGMPGAVARLAAAVAVLAPDAIGREVTRLSSPVEGRRDA